METDALAMRDLLFGLLDWQEINAVLDVGCGAGGDLRRIAAFASPSLRLVGVDSSAKAIEAARTATLADTRFAWYRADVSQGLPFVDGEFDALLTLNLLECVSDRAALAREMGRILRPGGRVVCAHWDWNTQTLDGTDKYRVRARLVRLRTGPILRRFGPARPDLSGRLRAVC